MILFITTDDLFETIYVFESSEFHFRARSKVRYMCSIYKLHDEAKYKVFMRWISDESKWEHQFKCCSKDGVKKCCSKASDKPCFVLGYDLATLNLIIYYFV